MTKRLIRTAGGLGLLLTAAAPLACGHGAGGTKAEPVAAASTSRPLLYPGADAEPAGEHVYLYPLDEALAAAQEVLEAHDFDVEPFKDETQLMTRWRVVGRPTGAGGSYVGSYQLRRYYIQGQALDAKHSVVRLFRIDREEEYRPGQMDNDLIRTALRAPGPRSEGKGHGSVADSAAGGWQQWVASGLEAERRGEERESQRERSTQEGRISPTSALLPAGANQRAMDRDPRFSNQYGMPSQDELRGRNERGVRDFVFEKELVQRLEQFPSLEFTGGAADLPPKPAGEGAAPLSLTWESEAGGMPFFHGPGCGEPVRGLDALAGAGTTVLVGEPLGTREVPSAVGNMACQLLERGRSVVLAVSLPREEQGALDTFLASDGSRAAQDALRSEASWRQVPRDGRSSRALLVLLERARHWRAAGKPVQVVAYDARGLKGNAREEAVAQLLLAQRKAHPEATLLALGGNYHVRVDASGAPWSRSFQPFGHRLAKAGVDVRALDTAFSRGTRWTCGVNRHGGPECRVYAAAPTEQSYSAPGKALSVELFPQASGEGFHGLLHVGALTASAPALLPPELMPRASR
ncbi:hypothetical protein FGE12_25575 [Aggregicoccus sp. 17bor-14]|uniref:hypothetical protein n=1 Tax=Myxococcaceae TaxID=31 RepID=UPI00129C27FC|nr:MULTISPECIES: hypothetical protein [Myxococcaceae]MBF5045804.1 hypothetical protein [Simulacricoccus sp. 17bor-14]MRI91539.1 hypothetical protein [Aggregicoccus sp. 17bor-14]